jgi:ketosteroid isomerase-like protein
LAGFLKGYDAAFNAKDLGRLAGYYHPDVTIFEGGSTNEGWADYRDHHLGPELEEFEGLEFSHAKVVPHLLGDGRSAYVTSEYRLKAKVGDRSIDAEGLETLVMLKGSDGAWRIRHSHTSSRRRPAATP